VAVHWPGTTQDRIGDPGEAAIAERLRHYRSYHLGKGWQDIGYNVAIDQAGRVWMLRSTQWHGNLVGAHCASEDNPNANRQYVGVLLILGDREPLSVPMIHAFRDWYHNRFLPRWQGRHDVRGHGEVFGAQTSCPGPYVRALVQDLTLQNPTQEEDDMFDPDVHIEAIATKVANALITNPVTGTDVPMQVYFQSINRDVWRVKEAIRAILADPRVPEDTRAAALEALDRKSLAS
jgi:hypothetical protein